MKTTRFIGVFVAVSVISLLGGCLSTRYIEKVYIPRQWQEFSEGPLGNTVWVEETRDLETVSPVVTESIRACGLQRVLRSSEAGRGFIPAHAFRLKLDTVTGTETRDIVFGQAESFNFIKVNAELIRVETFKPIATGVGKEYYGGGGRVSQQYGGLPFIFAVHKGPDDARQKAVAEAIKRVCNVVEFRDRRSGRVLTEEEAELAAAGIVRGPKRVVTPFVPIVGTPTAVYGYGAAGRTLKNGTPDLRYGCRPLRKGGC